ncbi:MAG TPA: type II toxin-antitoxin system CcdA family antitoxin [Gammaproteobacteria bacterium]|nr:type II toxin-antitoxin system CcdA family antitoxin [Gammaproteobacteria bacterium]HET7586648.1 type II toxin-antitoxin system CcdA family antitoxin [Gammaproteobacteria bacterium]
MQPNSQRVQKRPVNLTVNDELLQAARARHINLSATLESALREELRQAEQQQWLEENREAIKNYNRFVEENVFPGLERMF